MAKGTINRRQLLRYGSLLPVVALPLLPGCGGGAQQCVDPDMLSRGEQQMRKTREYIESSASAQDNCASCQFFRADGEGECGHCEILDGPVAARGYCNSWAA